MFLLAVLLVGAVHITYHALLLEVNGLSFLQQSVKLQSIENLSKGHVIAPNDIQSAEEHFAEVNGNGNNTSSKLQKKIECVLGIGREFTSRGKRSGIKPIIS